MAIRASRQLLHLARSVRTLGALSPYDRLDRLACGRANLLAALRRIAGLSISATGGDVTVLDGIVPKALRRMLGDPGSTRIVVVGAHRIAIVTLAVAAVIAGAIVAISARGPVLRTAAITRIVARVIDIGGGVTSSAIHCTSCDPAACEQQAEDRRERFHCGLSSSRLNAGGYPA